MPLSRELKDAINERCSRCGHTFYQHTNGGLRGRCEVDTEDLQGIERCSCDAFAEGQVAPNTDHGAGGAQSRELALTGQARYSNPFAKQEAK